MVELAKVGHPALPPMTSTLPQFPEVAALLARAGDLLAGFRDILAACRRRARECDDWGRLKGDLRRFEEHLAAAIEPAWLAQAAEWLPSDGRPTGRLPTTPPDPNLFTRPPFTGVPEVIVLRSVAVALYHLAKDELRDLYTRWLVARGGRIERGDLLHFDPCWPRPHDLYGAEPGVHYNTPPSKLETPGHLSPVPPFEIADDDCLDYFDVILDDTLSEPLDDLFSMHANPLIAVAVPNASIAEYNVACTPPLPPGIPPVRYRTTDDGIVHFFGVQPLDPAAQSERLVRMTAAALDQGARVILFPELSITREMLDTFRGTLEAAGQTCLLVPGSYHNRETTRHDVRGWLLWAQGGGEGPFLYGIEHQKFEPVRARIPNRDGEHVEDLDANDPGLPPRRVLRIYRGKRVRLLVLVCRDAIGKAAIEAILALRVNVVLVPAMSPTHDPFDNLANRVATDAQGMTVVAMTPFDASGPSAMLRLPRAESRPFWFRSHHTPGGHHGNPPGRVFVGNGTVELSPDDYAQPIVFPLPGLCLFNWRTFTCRWLDVETLAGT